MVGRRTFCNQRSVDVPGLHTAKAIMMVVAYTVSTKSSSRQANLILFLDAITGQKFGARIFCLSQSRRSRTALLLALLCTKRKQMEGVATYIVQAPSEFL